MLIYPTLYDHITKRQYPILVPNWFTGDFPEVMEGELMPIVQDEEVVDFVRGRFPIETMINMVANKIPFEFGDDRDLLDVKDFLERFVDEIFENLDLFEKETRDFVERSREFHTILVKLSRRILHCNTALRKAFEKEKPVSTLFQRLSGENPLFPAAGRTSLPSLPPLKTAVGSSGLFRTTTLQPEDAGAAATMSQTGFNSTEQMIKNYV